MPAVPPPPHTDPAGTAQGQSALDKFRAAGLRPQGCLQPRKPPAFKTSGGADSGHTAHTPLATLGKGREPWADNSEDLWLPVFRQNKKEVRETKARS